MNKKTLRLEAVHGPADGCVLEVPSDVLSVTVLGESCVPPRVHVYQRVRETKETKTPKSTGAARGRPKKMTHQAPTSSGNKGTPVTTPPVTKPKPPKKKLTPKPIMLHVCDTCQHWDCDGLGNNPAVGWCRRFPLKIRVHKSDWCGEYKTIQTT